MTVRIKRPDPAPQGECTQVQNPASPFPAGREVEAREDLYALHNGKVSGKSLRNKWSTEDLSALHTWAYRSQPAETKGKSA